MGLWQRMKVRLGLEDDWDEYYDEDEEYVEDDDTEFEAPGHREPYQSPYGSGAGPGAVKKLDRGPDLDRARSGGSLRSVPTGGASVTQMPANMKMHIVEPKSFTEAQTIVTQGPYRVIRHPGYLATMLVWVGSGLALGRESLKHRPKFLEQVIGFHAVFVEPVEACAALVAAQVNLVFARRLAHKSNLSQVRPGAAVRTTGHAHHDFLILQAQRRQYRLELR